MNIQNLLKNFTIEEIESAYVYKFIQDHDLNLEQDEYIRSYLTTNYKKNAQLDSKIERMESIFDLVTVFEQLIPKEEKKLNGAFYTPKYISDYIVSETLSDRKSPTVIDLSCGSGAFILSILEWYRLNRKESLEKVVSDYIYGIDISTQSINRAKILIHLYLSLYSYPLPQKINLYVANSLSIGKLKEIDGLKFDCVVGNPPYVKFQDLTERQRSDFPKTFRSMSNGNYNLYFPFFEVGMSVLKENGNLGYIVPNNFFTSLAGYNLRNFLSKNKFLKKIIDFGSHKVFNVQTYTCLVFLTKEKSETFEYTKSPEGVLKDLVYSKIEACALDDKKWRLLSDCDFKNIQKIEKLPNKLGSIFQIKTGIATCKDNIYFVNSKLVDGKFYQKKLNGKIYHIEANITRPICKIPEIIDQNELCKNTKRIIFPYKQEKNSIIEYDESELKSRFPKCYEYLLACKDELNKRDKGKKKYNHWYSYARSQGLSSTGIRLYTPTFSKTPRFLLDDNSFSLFCNGYGIFEKDTEELFSPKLNLQILQKVLNSAIMYYYINSTSVSIEGDYYCYQKNFIEKFGIPDFSIDEINYLKKENNPNNINSFLASKYNINLPEIYLQS